MKDTSKQMEFIRLRAEGKSYRAIEQEIGVSKSTCSEWQRKLSSEIESLRQSNLEELYSAYGMTKEARIRRIGDTLRQIETALQEVDFSRIPPEKLLNYKLRYQAALKDEYNVIEPIG